MPEGVQHRRIESMAAQRTASIRSKCYLSHCRKRLIERLHVPERFFHLFGDTVYLPFQRTANQFLRTQSHGE